MGETEAHGFKSHVERGFFLSDSSCDALSII